MNFVLTINQDFNVFKIEEMLKYAESREIRDIRFNLCKYPLDKLDDAAAFFEDIILKYKDCFAFGFDLPYPKDSV